jgi:putative PEP-CTERM system histidine kinase
MDEHSGFEAARGSALMTLMEVFTFATAAFSGLLGVAALVRRRPTIVQWSFATGMLLLAGEAVLAGMSMDATPEELVPHLRWMQLIVAALPLPWIIFSLSYARGGYAAVLRRWAVPLYAGGLLPIGIALAGWQELIAKIGFNEATGDWFLRLGPAGSAVKLLLLLASILVLMNVERTFRGSIGTARWRVKYMVLGVAVLFGARVYAASQELLFSGAGAPILMTLCAALLVGNVLIVIGVLRTGVAQVDVYPSRSIIHNSLTVLVAGVYLLVVGVLAKVVTAWGGSEALPVQAFLVLVALVVLTILLLSERLRDHIKRFVSRHFRRPHYDYAQVWSTFAERTASMIDAVSLSRAVTKWLSETFRALSVTMWFMDSVRGGLVYGASTSISEEEGRRLLPSADTVPDLARKLVECKGPIDLETSKADWAMALSRAYPDTFQKGGGKMCVPIFAGEELLGLIVLAERVNGVPFTVEEVDLLKRIAAQLAANLQNIQLSQRLLHAKEMEAFQAMSAFFVHDLKNTASTLSLMLQNLPVHFDDPEFRADALRGLTKSVNRINELISRLGLLRQESNVKLDPADLNDVVSRSIAELPPFPGIKISQALNPIPKIPLDADKVQKVTMNILINAADALDGHGEISVTTEQREGWVALSITDTGPGMSPEFMSRSLFRPFQTTKKKGIGIGMFLSKAIIEAHRGKIEVASQPGKGTTFRVLLPME